MISSRITAAVLLVASLGAVHAQPLQTAPSREQVRAELRDAQRRGDVPLPGELGLKPRELAPDRYAVPPAAQGLTRAQVVAQLIALGFLLFVVTFIVLTIAKLLLLRLNRQLGRTH